MLPGGGAVWESGLGRCVGGDREMSQWPCLPPRPSRLGEDSKALSQTLLRAFYTPTGEAALSLTPTLRQGLHRSLMPHFFLVFEGNWEIWVGEEVFKREKSWRLRRQRQKSFFTALDGVFVGVGFFISKMHWVGIQSFGLRVFFSSSEGALNLTSWHRARKEGRTIPFRDYLLRAVLHQVLPYVVPC